jgi:uncharacterized protein
MVGRVFHRRTVLAGLACATTLPSAGFADEVTDLEWSDLLPEEELVVPRALAGLIDHDSEPLSSQQPASTGRRNDWNGKIVRLPGFVVPIDQSSAGVTAFILVPYVGACVHVPPPPANQLVFVTTEKPYPLAGLFEAVNVTGMFGTASTYTQIAQIGYALSADEIAPFKV